MEDVRAFLQERGERPHSLVPVIGPSASDRPSEAIEQAIFQRQWTRLQEHLVSLAGDGSVRDVTNLFVATQLTGVHPAELCDHIISPAMHQVGQQWATNRITVGEEHLISHAISAALIETATYWGEVERLPYRSLCGCLAPDLHELGSQCVAHLLAFVGFDVALLGAATPVESFVAAIERHKPNLVCVSATVVHDPVALTTDCRRLAHAARSHGSALVLGGSGLLDRELPCPDGDAVLIRDMGGLVEYVRQTFPPAASAGEHEARFSADSPGARRPPS
jgi:methanogenic corrinoid protein MtbC1